MSCGDIFYILTPVLGPVLRFIYDLVNNYGLSIIIFSVVIKVVMFPLSVKQYKSTLAMRKLQPELNKLQKKYGQDREKLQKEQMELYQKHNISPAAGCLPMLIQMPILFALYRVIMQPLTYIAGIGSDTIVKVCEKLGEKASVASMNQISIAEKLGKPEIFEKVKDIIPDFSAIDFNFLGINLADVPKFGFSTIDILWIIPVLAGLTALLNTWVVNKTNGVDENQQTSQMKGMMYMMPLMSVYFCFILPCGMGIYWIINNVIAIIQQLVMTKLMFRNVEE